MIRSGRLFRSSFCPVTVLLQRVSLFDNNISHFPLNYNSIINKVNRTQNLRSFHSLVKHSKPERNYVSLCLQLHSVNRYSSQSNFNLPVAESTMSAMGEKELSQYVLPLDQPISLLDCSDAFNGLEPKEKLYAHYLSEASWYGGLAVAVQTSHESSMIFSLLLDIFKSNGLEGLKTTAIQSCGFSEDDWRALLVYACGVFGNSGNYKSFGDTKIIPGVSVEKVDRLVENAKFTGNQNVQEKWLAIKDKIYSLTLKEKQLGLGEKGTTTYFSENCTTEDGDLINRFMKEQKTEAYITRLFKTVNGATTHYEIRAASEELDSGTPKVYDFEGAKITFTKGDYSPIMKRCADSLEKAKEYAANENEVKMLEQYIESFRKGSLDAHKEGSRFWIKDKGPAIETYIGFIETYRDPYGTRGEFEGFVSIVNRAMSAKFTALVENAKSFLTLLPWPSQYEIENFQKPDFTSLDVLTFSGSGIPAGINIPNYTEIRQNEGFKNVSLGNVIVAGSKYKNIPFLSEEDKEIFDKYRIESFEVQVGLHELLGHGSGKLMMKNADGTTNYPADLKNPLTNELIESMYEAGETYDSVFLSLGSAFEECRAECVGLLLSLNHDVLKIFGFEGEEAEKVIYVNWLSMIFAGAAKALEMYQPETKCWMQAHSQARFAIGQALIEAGEGLIDIKQTVGSDGKPDLLITLDRTKINTVGRKAISDFLLKIQVYRSLADVKSARQMFDHYTSVNDDGCYPWASWREIIMDKKQPRKIYAQCNTSIADDSNVVLQKYEATHEGFIQSLVDRFPGNSAYECLDYCWKKDKPYF